MSNVPIDLTALIKRILLRIVDVQQQVIALRIALETLGTLTPELMASSQAQAEVRLREIRKEIESAETSDEARLLELLRDFEGPLQ
jgi:hypothetical protein